MNASNLFVDQTKIFESSLHLSNSHAYEWSVDTDRFRNDDRRYDELRHQIFVGLYCEYLALHHDVDVTDDLIDH